MKFHKHTEQLAHCYFLSELDNPDKRWKIYRPQPFAFQQHRVHAHWLVTLTIADEKCQFADKSEMSLWWVARRDGRSLTWLLLPAAVDAGWLTVKVDRVLPVEEDRVLTA